MLRKAVPSVTLIAALLAAMPALAQTARTPAPKRDWADYYMVRVDTERKGYITPADAQRYATRQFARLDHNHDGVVDHAEFMTSLQRAIERATDDERKARLERSLERRETLFHSLDQKSDGKITKEEYLAATAQHFADIDVEHTGKITTEMLRAAHHGL